jgi:hypothetical protein
MTGTLIDLVLILFVTPAIIAWDGIMREPW